MSDITLHPVEGQDGLLVAKLLGLPHKILHHHDVHGLEQVILHELGHNHNFNLSKAGYFVDNPDFGCLKGVAGYSKDECEMHQSDVWDNPHTFVESMKQAPFQKALAQFIDHSLARSNGMNTDNDAFKGLGEKIGMQNPSIITWKMKHGNHGILLFEAVDAGHARKKDLLQHFAALLSLC